MFSVLIIISQMSLKSGFGLVEAVKFMPCDDFSLQDAVKGFNVCVFLGGSDVGKFLLASIFIR